jgi:hypothetical protein
VKCPRAVRGPFFRNLKLRTSAPPPRGRFLPLFFFEKNRGQKRDKCPRIGTQMSSFSKTDSAGTKKKKGVFRKNGPTFAKMTISSREIGLFWGHFFTKSSILDPFFCPIWSPFLVYSSTIASKTVFSMKSVFSRQFMTSDPIIYLDSYRTMASLRRFGP